MTTDTYPKTSIKNVKIQNTNINIYGFAKGSGMIQPNMGTMLVYIFIECLLNKNQLKKLIRQNLENSFNSISVDSDTSTSDTLMLFSTSNKKINLKSYKNFKKLSKQHKELKSELQKINKDVGYKFGNQNNFKEKIDELNQETETLIDEIEKWQT